MAVSINQNAVGRATTVSPAPPTNPTPPAPKVQACTWTTRPTLPQVGDQIQLTDHRNNVCIWNGTNWIPVGPWAQSATAASHTGSTANTTLATIEIPAGILGKDGVVRVSAQWSCTASANLKYMGIDFGAENAYLTDTNGASTAVSAIQMVNIRNRGNMAVQLVNPSFTGGVQYTTNQAKKLLAQNTVNAVNLKLSMQLANATDTVTLEAYTVELFPAGIIGSVDTPTRNPLLQPFASNSIWNTPIGSGAVYVAANIDPTPADNVWAKMPGADGERIALTPNAPLTDIKYSNVAWGGGNRCVETDPTRVKIDSVPMPYDMIIPNTSGNEGGVFLRPDGRTIVQAQPMARCAAGGYATALLKFADVDLYGTGITGGHGGSGLSSFGGCIRMGELRPGQQGPKHALKIGIYARQALYKSTTRAEGYRWPATQSDSYSVGWYGADNNNTNTAMKMGSLLAIPASVDINTLGLITEPAKQLAWTFQNYGGYIVDDSYAPGFDLSIENGYHGSKAAEFLADYGFPFVQKVNDNSPWVQDIQKIVAALYVVDNNASNNIGGGGTPLQPLAPAIAP